MGAHMVGHVLVASQDVLLQLQHTGVHIAMRVARGCIVGVCVGVCMPMFVPMLVGVSMTVGMRRMGLRRFTSANGAHRSVRISQSSGRQYRSWRRLWGNRRFWPLGTVPCRRNLIRRV